MKRIDFEAHYYTQEFLNALAGRKEIPIYDPASHTMYHGGDGIICFAPIFDQLTDLSEDRIRNMDEAGIDTAILSATLGIEQLPEEEGCREAEKINRQLAQAVRCYPDRLRGYAMLNVKNVDRAADELKHCREEYGFVGWNAFSNYGEHNLDDEEMFPLFRTAVELGMFVYIHPTVPREERLHGYGPAMVTSGLGFAVDVTIAVTRLIFSGIFERLPDLKIVIGHSGEAFSSLIGRMDDAYRRASASLSGRGIKMPSEYFKKNIWLTTSGNFSQPAFFCAVDSFGIDHIMFGSDYPMENLRQSVDFVDHLPISPDGISRIYYKNAEQYFDI